MSIKSLSGMCTLDDKLLLVDSEENQILLLNKNFELEDRIKKIGNESFNSTLNICTDQHGETVYLIDYNNNRVLIIDRNIKTIKKYFLMMIISQSVILLIFHFMAIVYLF